MNIIARQIANQIACSGKIVKYLSFIFKQNNVVVFLIYNRLCIVWLQLHLILKAEANNIYVVNMFGTFSLEVLHSVPSFSLFTNNNLLPSVSSVLWLPLPPAS